MSTYYQEAAAAVAATHKLNAHDMLEIARFALCAMGIISVVVGMV